MITKPKISVVMVCWNRKDEVRNSLEHLYRSDFSDYEVIVVDNASSDGTSEMILSEFPEVQLLRLEKNIGIAGFNRGFEMAQGKYILVLDDDSYPEQDTIGKGYRYFEKESDDVAIIACRILNPLRNNFDSTQNWPHEMITFWGCGAFIRRDVVARLGGYREDFFLYRNEIELSLRFLSYDYITVYEPNLIVYHNKSPMHRSSSRTFRYANRNDIYIFNSYFGLLHRLNFLSKIFILTFLKSLFKYSYSDFYFIWNQSRHSSYFKLLKKKNRYEFITRAIWRELNILQPKFSDLLCRLISDKIIW